MLSGLRHYSSHLYKKLAYLAKDLQSEGEIHQWFVKSSGLSSREIEAITERTLKAFALLQSDCENGNLKLDLKATEFLYGTDNTKPSKEHSCRPY